MKITYIVLTLMFLLFAAFQFNDPDREIWAPLYGYAAAMSFFMFLGRMTNITWPLIGLIAFSITAIVDWPATFEGMENAMTMMRPEIEKARETSGMLISAAVMLFYIIMIFKNKKS
ncbi:MAG TPA: transmembrane 220 family protein [Cytophagales bacterium]|nr:transmembrane 220 family protein [Cytophagales bacterium]